LKAVIFEYKKAMEHVPFIPINFTSLKFPFTGKAKQLLASNSGLQILEQTQQFDTIVIYIRDD
jgi:hypothetical protein